jgi:hypothetical protein
VAVEGVAPPLDKPEAILAYAERAGAKLDPAAFRARVETLRGEFGGLLDEEALALFVLDELGLNEEAYVTLRDARGRGEASVRVRVVGSPIRRTFQRKDGAQGEVVNVPIEDASDPSARATLVLWDRDAEKAQPLKIGTTVHVANARVKDGKFGLELQALPWTLLEIPGALSPARAKLLADVAPDAAARDLRTVGPADGSPSRAPGVQAVLPVAGPPSPPATLREALAPPPLPTGAVAQESSSVSLRDVRGLLESIEATQAIRAPDGSTRFQCRARLRTPQGPLELVAEGDSILKLRHLPIGVRLRATNVRRLENEFRTTESTSVERLT